MDAGALRLAAALDATGRAVAIGLLTNGKYLLAPAERLDGGGLLAGDLSGHHPGVRGWMGPAAAARRFAAAWKGEVVSLAGFGHPPMASASTSYTPLRHSDAEAMRPPPSPP